MNLIGVTLNLNTCSIYPRETASKPDVHSQLEWDAMGQRVADEKPEAIDIPAIRGACLKSHDVCEGDIAKGDKIIRKGKWCWVVCDEEGWSCKKFPKRGLWHDESVPPHFYCRKPQTEAR